MVQFTDFLEFFTEFAIKHGIFILRETGEQLRTPPKDPKGDPAGGLPWIAYAAWAGHALPETSNTWRPVHTTKISEIRYVLPELGGKFEVLDLDGDVDQDLTKELNEGIARLHRSVQ